MGKSLLASTMKNQTKRRQAAKGKAAAAAEQAGQQESPADNNNEQDFRSLNQQPGGERLRVKQLNLSDDDEQDDGRGCSGASSTNSSDEDSASSGRSTGAAHKLSNESLAASSGRSSAAAQVGVAAGGLEQEPNGWHSSLQQQQQQQQQQPEALALIERVRARFWDALKEQELDKYEALDLDELRHALAADARRPRALRLIGRFLNFRQLLEQAGGESGEAAAEGAREKAVAEAADKLREFLQFRRHYQLSRVRADQFCKEIHQLHGIFPFGLDKNRLPVLYLRARVHRRWSAPLDETFKRYVAWQVDTITRSSAGASASRPADGHEAAGRAPAGSFGICFDCLNVSYACVDMEFLSYLVKILVHFYPTYCRYALCVDLPWLFRSVWKLVRSWLPEEAQQTVHLITSKQLVEFIDEDQIPNSMKINELAGGKKAPRGKHKMPANFNSMQSFEEQAGELKLSASEIKQFKSHMEKVLKEYEQLGAI